MSSGAAHRSRFRHELVLHGSTAELLEFAVPFAREGVAAGESTLLLVRPEITAALREVGHLPHLTFLSPLGQPGRGAADLRATDALLTASTTPTSGVRILHQEPAVPEAHWHEWRRLEAAVNLAFSRHDVWVVCAYDRRTLTEEMVDDLHAAHQAVGRGSEHRHNDRYQDPVEFISKHMDAPPDPVEASPPSAELLDPSPSTARAAVGAFAINSKLPPQEVENMVLATHEVVSNARLHGRPPVVLRALGASRPAHRHGDGHRHRPDEPVPRTPASRPSARLRPRPVDQPPARRHDPPPPPRRLHGPPDRNRFVPVRR